MNTGSHAATAGTTTGEDRRSAKGKRLWPYFSEVKALRRRQGILPVQRRRQQSSIAHLFRLINEALRLVFKDADSKPFVSPGEDTGTVRSALRGFDSLTNLKNGILFSKTSKGGR